VRYGRPVPKAKPSDYGVGRSVCGSHDHSAETVRGGALAYVPGIPAAVASRAPPVSTGTRACGHSSVLKGVAPRHRHRMVFGTTPFARRP
jgi:hypothetical protein